MPLSIYEKTRLSANYTNSNRVLFGKILDKNLRNPQPEFGFFQTALTITINEFTKELFRYKRLHGFGMSGTCFVPPSNAVPIFGTTGGTPGTAACITSAISMPVTYEQVVTACKDQVYGFWAKLFQLLAKSITNTTIVLSNPSAFGFTYTVNLKTVYPWLPLTWLTEGRKFGEQIQAKRVDDHDYLFMLLSEKLEKLIREIRGTIFVPSWPCAGAFFSGTITADWYDYNLL